MFAVLGSVLGAEQLLALCQQHPVKLRVQLQRWPGAGEGGQIALQLVPCTGGQVRLGISTRTAAPTPCPLQTVVLYAVLQAAADGAVQRAVLLPAGGAAVGHAVTPGAVLQRGLVS